MPKSLFNIPVKQNLSGNGIVTRISLGLKNHFKMNTHQIVVLVWLKGLWTGILISLILHQLFSH